jgi:hypothetical protein
MGVQFWGAPQSGWARILFDGLEVWRGLTSSLGFEQLQYGGYVEISGFEVGRHTIRAESLGFDYHPLTAASYRTRAGFVAAGALSAFSFLGALSVGLFYLPLVRLQLATAVASRVHTRDRLSTSAGLLVGAALLQGVIMFAIVQLV